MRSGVTRSPTNIKYETGNEFSLLLKLKLRYMYSDMNYAVAVYGDILV